MFCKKYINYEVISEKNSSNKKSFVILILGNFCEVSKCKAIIFGGSQFKEIFF